MIIVRQDRNVFYNWDNVVDIYISRISKTEILLDSTAASREPLGDYTKAENAKAAFEKLIENISKEIPLVVVRTDEEIDKSIHRGTESSSEEE